MQKNYFSKRRSILTEKKGIADAVNGLQILLAAIVFFGLMGLVGAILGLIQSDISTELDDGSIANALSVVNESTGGINQTGYNLAVVNASTSGYTLTAVWDTNATGTTYAVPLANVTVSTSGVVQNATIITYGSNATVSYTYTYTTQGDPSQEYQNLQNATAAQGNIFERLGLIGTVIVLVFILILILGVVGYFLSGNYTSGQFS